MVSEQVYYIRQNRVSFTNRTLLQAIEQIPAKNYNEIMKIRIFTKAFFAKVFALVVFPCFFSCKAASSAFTVENASSVSVTVVAKNTSTEYTLQPQEIKSIDDPLTLSLKDNPRVEFSYPQAQYYYISDLKKYTYTVYNNKTASVVLGEENGMLGENYNSTVTLEAAETPPSTTSVSVYTSSPSFYAYLSGNENAKLTVTTSTSTDSDGNEIYTININ